MSNVPLVDLAAQHNEIVDEVMSGFERVMSATAFVGGPDVEAFENEFASYCHAAHCVGVANGTDAIEIALKAGGIEPDDEVIVPANTFIATVGAVHRTGARPILVDCDAEHLLIDPMLAEKAITNRTTAVVGVDLYGQLAPLDQLHEIIGDRDIAVFEDAAQSQGATRFGDPMGTGAKAAATSFYPGKNLGAYGDAGAIITDDEELAATARAMANHGGVRKYEHRVPGFNSRLDTLQAVVLRAKLARLDGWNEARRRAAARYDELLAPLAEVGRVPVAEGNVHVWHLYVIRVPERDRVLAELNAAGIGAGIHYAAPVHLTDAFRFLADGPGSFPNAEAASREMISLPIHPHLAIEDQDRVVEALIGALR
ncbi:MAG: DegT/DnrJ/EryC1/StrS family aminotransferase [Acidimicrobiales bacterium]